MIAPAATPIGSASIASIALSWLLACGVPWRVARASLLLGVVLILPYAVLVAWVGDGGGGVPVEASWWKPAGFAVRGMAGMLVSIGTVTALTASDLRNALRRLPIPGMVSAIVLQIVHQAAELGGETRRIASAMAVRGASRGRGGWRVLMGLPTVWLPRVILRAERVGAAMEVRGYCEQPVTPAEKGELRAADLIAWVAVAVALAASVALRWVKVS